MKTNPNPLAKRIGSAADTGQKLAADPCMFGQSHPNHCEDISHYLIQSPQVSAVIWLCSDHAYLPVAQWDDDCWAQYYHHQFPVNVHL